MKSRIFLAVCGLVVVVVVWVLYAHANQRSDRELLEELRKLSAVEGDKHSAQNLTPAQRTKRGEAALDLLKDFESRHASSSLLNEARSETLKVLTQGGAVQPGAADVAQKLAADAPKGSDFAAQGDLFLFVNDVEPIFKDARGRPEELKDLWYRNAETIRKRMVDFLTTYPNYRAGADYAELLAERANGADDPKTRRTLVDLVAKNQPDHPLARIALRDQVLGKEFVFAFRPVGSAQPMSIKHLRGKVVVVDFWATWCAPCLEELPALKRFYEEYRTRGVEIIGVSLDQQEKTLTDFVEKKGVPWPQVFGRDAQTLAGEWGVKVIPTVFLIDRQGRLRSLEARGKLEKLVPQLLAEK
jgi:thiol-disulfide isomerase/thioredoxin